MIGRFRIRVCRGRFEMKNVMLRLWGQADVIHINFLTLWKRVRKGSHL